MHRDWNVLSTTAYLVGLFLDHFPLVPKECPITRLECTPLLYAQIVPVFVSWWTWRSALHQRQDHSSCVSGAVKLRTECPHTLHRMKWCVCAQLVTKHTLRMEQGTHHTHSGWSKEHTTHTQDGARNTPHTTHTGLAVHTCSQATSQS